MQLRSRMCTVLVALAAAAGLTACGEGGSEGQGQQGGGTTTALQAQDLKDAARRQCLNAAKEVPEPTARRLAEEQCRRSTQ